MSADGVIARSVGELRDLELTEMAQMLDRMREAVTEANARAGSSDNYADLCMRAAQAMLFGFQLQDAATRELINHLVLDPNLDEKTKRLLANLNEARRAGLRRGETSRPLQAAAE